MGVVGAHLLKKRHRRDTAKVGADHRTGMQGEGPYAEGLTPVIEFHGKEVVGRFRLTIALQCFVVPAVEIGIVKIKGRHLVAIR